MMWAEKKDLVVKQNGDLYFIVCLNMSDFFQSGTVDGPKQTHNMDINFH